MPANEKPLLTHFLLVDSCPFYHRNILRNNILCLMSGCVVCKCCRSLSIFWKRQKNPYPICLRSVVLEVWLVRALFIACKLCWDYNLRAFCTVFKLYSVCLPRMQTGRFPEDKSQSWRFGQLCRGHEMCIGLTGGPQYIYTLMPILLLINQSSSTYIFLRIRSARDCIIGQKEV